MINCQDLSLLWVFEKIIFSGTREENMNVNYDDNMFLKIVSIKIYSFSNHFLS